MITVDNILKSGFSFGEGEDILRFRFRMLNIMLLTGMVAMFAFWLLDHLEINLMVEPHLRIIVLTGILCFLSLIWLRQSKEYYKRVVFVTICTLLLSFTSALIYVPNDEFRMIWFVIGTIAGHLALNNRFGLFIATLSIAIIFISSEIFSLNLGTQTLTTVVISLLIINRFLSSYIDKFDSYEALLLQKNRELMALINIDELTGIMSRRFFMDVSEHYFSGSRRTKTHMSLMMLDIDHFKMINDNYGHNTGDEMLKIFGTTISKHLRKSDVFARLGGEEFGIILFDTDLKGASILAEYLRNAIDDLSYQEGSNTVTMTTSIGVAELSEDDKGFNDMLRRADNALYRSKRDGRNRVSLA